VDLGKLHHEEESFPVNWIFLVLVVKGNSLLLAREVRHLVDPKPKSNGGGGCDSWLTGNAEHTCRVVVHFGNGRNLSSR
jgi:hypothetical protein